MTWHKTDKPRRINKKAIIITTVVIAIFCGIIVSFPIARAIEKDTILTQGVTTVAYSTGEYAEHGHRTRRSIGYTNFHVIYTFKASDGKTYTAEGVGHKNYRIYMPDLMERLEGEEIQITYLEEDPTRYIVHDENWK